MSSITFGLRDCAPMQQDKRQTIFAFQRQRQNQLKRIENLNEWLLSSLGRWQLGPCYAATLRVRLRLRKATRQVKFWHFALLSYSFSHVFLLWHLALTRVLHLQYLYQIIGKHTAFLGYIFIYWNAASSRRTCVLCVLFSPLYSTCWTDAKRKFRTILLSPAPPCSTFVRLGPTERHSKTAAQQQHYGYCAGNSREGAARLGEVQIDPSGQTLGGAHRFGIADVQRPEWSGCKGTEVSAFQYKYIHVWCIHHWFVLF